MDELRQEISDYYRTIAPQAAEGNPAYARVRREVWEAMDRFAKGNPSANAALAKARLHEELSERFEPVIFPHSPFFFEMAVRPAGNCGQPSPLSAGAWMHCRRQGLCTDTAAWKNLNALASPPFALWTVRGPFGREHEIGYGRLFRLGLAAVIDQVQMHKDISTDDDRPFLEAAARSGYAMLAVAKRFARKAETMLAAAPNAGEKNLRTILDAASRAIAAAPKTLYEGLAMLLFCHEVTASMEGVPVALPRQVDRLLIELYRGDLAASRLDEQGVADLIARWLLHIEGRCGEPRCLELLAGEEANELTQRIAAAHGRAGLTLLTLRNGPGPGGSAVGSRCEISVPRVLELCLQPLTRVDLPPKAKAALPKSHAPALTWEDFHHQFTDTLSSLMHSGGRWLGQMAACWPRVQPCPLLSAWTDGCIESAKDCIAMDSGVEVALVGVDEAACSLAAIKRAVYDHRAGTLAGAAARLGELARDITPVDPLVAAIARDLGEIANQ